MQDNNQFRDDSFLPAEWAAFVHQVSTEDLTPQPAIGDYDDHVWKAFTSEVECAEAARTLEIENGEAAPRPRLRSERPDEEASEDLFKSSGNRERKKMQLREWFHTRIASGESAESIIKFSAERSPSTAAILKELLEEGL